MLTILLSILGAFGALALIGAGIVVLRSSAKTQATEIWRGEAEAQKERADRLENELKDFRAEFSRHKREMQDSIERLTIENNRLAELVSGTEALTKLSAEMRANHLELTALIVGVNKSDR